MTTRQTPLGAVGRGILAGAVGTVAMDLLMYRRYRKGGGAQPLPEWEFSAGLDDWDNAPAPAHIGKRVVEGLFLVTLDPTRWARTMNNVMHWGYGLAWGAQYGLVAGSAPSLPHSYGLALGPVVFASGYVVLPLAKLYKPIWEYDGPTIAKDLGAHMVYGIATAEAFRLLSPRRGRRRARRAQASVKMGPTLGRAR